MIGLLVVLVLLAVSTAHGQSGSRDESAQLTVQEETPVRTVVGNLSDLLRRPVQAFWGTAPRDLQFRLSFPDAFFSVSSAGEVMLHSRLDREDERACPQQSAIDCAIELNVIVTQRGTLEPAQRLKLRVLVRDVNDHAPQIAPVVYVQVAESDPSQPFVSSVLPLEKATDADVSYNGQVSYQLETASDKFELVTRKQNARCEQDAVCLFVKDRLDREQASSYALRVLAVDGGAPSLSTRFVLNVTVLDVNDHVPQFVGTPYQVYIPSVLSQVTA